MVIYRGNNRVRKVALTFDDGPNPEYTPKILKLLKDNNVKATFFLIGKNTEKYPNIAQQIISEGHEIGNHTYTHPRPRLSGILNSSTDPKNLQKAKKDIIEEIEKGADAIKIAANISDNQLKFLRPPALGWNLEVAEVTRPIYGNRIIMSYIYSDDWNWDWQNNWSNESVINAKTDEIFNTVVENAEPGAIIGLHDSSEKGLPEHGSLEHWEKRAIPTFLALPKVIKFLQSKELKAVKLSGMDLIEEPLVSRA